METIEKLKLQIANVLQKLDLLREENSQLRNRLLKLESENKAKDEYIRVLEQKIATSAELKSLDAKG